MFIIRTHLQYEINSFSSCKFSVDLDDPNNPVFAYNLIKYFLSGI